MRPLFAYKKDGHIVESAISKKTKIKSFFIKNNPPLLQILQIYKPLYQFFDLQNTKYSKKICKFQRICFYIFFIPLLTLSNFIDVFQKNDFLTYTINSVIVSF